MRSRFMHQPLRVEQLESRDLPSGGLGIVEAALSDPIVRWDQATIPSCLANAAAIIRNVELSASGIAGSLFGNGGGAANGNAAQRWDQLLVGTWYVPSFNLLAYLVGPTGTNPQPIADQTIFQITNAYDGFFVGQNAVELSLPTPLGWLSAQPLLFTMSGFVTPDGQIRITFTPTQSGQPPITGVGNMELLDGSWRMTMQMATGTAPYVIHWAYMTKLTPGATPPAPGQAVSESLTISQQWSWLLNTDWALSDTELFGSPSVGVFQIQGYDHGYFWGKGVGPAPFTVVGSVTPEGNLFLVLTPEGGSSVTRTGTLSQGVSGNWVMSFRSYEGSVAFGEAWLIG